MPKNKLSFAVCAAAILAAALLAYFFLFSGVRERHITIEKHLSINSVPLNIAIADTPQEREHGLSGTTGLSSDEGMLFVFDHDDQYSFWMKDMNYSIDIIWISAAKRVVYIEKAVSPDTFPQAFTPPTPARYVLEVPAGFSDAHGLRDGAAVDF